MTFKELEAFSIIYHHKFVVLQHINIIIQDLIKRAEEHDMSKFSESEFAGLIAAHEDIQAHPFGTPEHEEARKKHSTVFNSHYKENRHHPEHFENGVEGMTLVDLIEMLCDWKSSSMRTSEGSIENSIKSAAEKYNIEPQLLKILENTAESCKM